MRKPKANRVVVASNKATKKTLQPPENPAGGSRFFVRPVAEIQAIQEEIVAPIEEEQAEINFHLHGKGQHVATRLCLNAMDVEGNGIQVWGDFFENKRIIRIEGSYPGWRLIRSISADQAVEMIENICVFLEAAGEYGPKK